MTNTSSQRRIASELLKVGVNRVWISPEDAKKVEGAITREDVRRLISKGIIGKKPEIGTSRGRARDQHEKRKKGRLRGAGKVRGKTKAGKREWINTIRPIRRVLSALLEKDEITKEDYKDLYAKAGGGFFRSKTHLKLHMQKEGMRKK